jgi:hypothetical protein
MGLLDWLKPPPPEDAELNGVVDRVVARLDPMLRSVADYRRRLAPAVTSARAYCAAIAAQIPGPIEISRPAFASNPLVHALFASADDIERMLARSDCVREHLVGATPAMGDRCCALLGMRHREKAGFGAQLAGDLVHYDTPQTTLYFTDHTLAEPSPGLQQARLRLTDVMFDSLVESLATHVAAVREEHQGLHTEQAIETARQRAGHGPEDHMRRLADLEARLRATGDALQPAQLIDTLVDCLQHPEPYLRLDPVTVAVDRSGVIVGAGDAAHSAGDILNFVELTSRDKRRWVVMLAYIERAEACAAVERFEAARRHIVI